MPGCARINGITADLSLSQQASCNKVRLMASTHLFTLNLGSCLISSANSFASPLFTAANMRQIERRRRRKNIIRKEIRKEIRNGADCQAHLPPSSLSPKTLNDC